MSPTACETLSIGVVVGVTAEAGCLRGCLLPHLVARSGADTARAERAARDLVARGVRGLVSFGLAGGLADEMRPGDAIVPAEVILEDGRPVFVDGEWGRATGASGTLLAVDHAVSSVTEKRELARRTGAFALDMESGAVARVALEHGLPFIVVRAIADPAGRSLPSALEGVIAPDGRTRIGRLALNLIRAPGQIVDLVGLSLDSRAGLTTLKTLARGLCPPPASST